MNILQTTRSMDPRMGGTAEAVRLLTDALRRLDHRVEIATLDAPDAPWVQQQHVHALGPASGVYGYSSRFLPWLKANAQRFDAVIVNGTWQYHSFGTWLALRRTGVPYVIFPHGMLDVYFKQRYPLKHLKKWLYWPWSDYRVLRDAAATLFTAEQELHATRRSFWLYRANERVVGFGIDRHPKIPSDLFFRKYPQLSDRRLLLFLGRLHPIKGLDLLLKAFARECADPAWHLVVAGPTEGQVFQNAQVLARSIGISQRITWAGMVRGEEKHSLLSAAEALVLPSHHESFGIVIVEALRAGLPVLISDQVCIHREVLRHGAGLVASDTEDGTRELLRKWIALDDHQRRSFQRASLKCYESEFDIDQVAQRLCDILQSATAPIEFRPSGVSAPLAPSTVAATTSQTQKVNDLVTEAKD